MKEPYAGLPFEPMIQRNRDYMRQRQMTISDLLLDHRSIFLGSVGQTIFEPTLTAPLANLTIQQLLYLQYDNRNHDIHFYINSPGGAVTATLALYDTMQYLECPISTYCMGLAASGAAILLAAGTKGKRFALPHSKIMIHQPMGGVYGQATDVEIQANEYLKDRHRLNLILAKATGQPLDVIEKATDRDKWFTAQEAKEFGLVDTVLEKISEEKPS